MTNEDDEWTRRDAISGVMFLISGLLIIAFALTAMRNDFTLPFWGSAWFLGPIFVAMGVNAIYKGARSARRHGRRSEKPTQSDRTSDSR